MNPFQAREIWPPGTVVDRKYIVHSTIGRGGFGTVYLVNHRVLGHDYVIKRLHSQFAEDPEFINRFVKEAQAIARLKGCPHIVEVFDMTQTDDGQLILVMEHMPGGDLAGLIQKVGRFTVADAVWYAQQVAQALKAAHAANFVHRDVKPQNVLLSADRRFAKLTDFGIVTDRGSARTTSVMRTGSEGFAAPEQWQLAGKHLDGRTDLYALGATIYLMLTGRMPYGELDIRDWVAAVQSGPPQSMGAAGVDVPAELDRLVIQMLEADREKRPSDVGEVIERLAAPMEHTHPGTIVERPRPQPKRPETVVEPEVPKFKAELLREFRGHTGSVESARFSPDGKWILTSSEDATARVWNAASGEPVARLDHAGKVLSAHFSNDGQRVVTSCWDKTARLWNPATGEQVAAFEGHAHFIYEAQFSPDGQRVVTPSADGTARVWEAATGRPMATLKGHGSYVFSARFSPDGERVVTASADHTARVWDAQTGESIATLMGHADGVLNARYSPDGQRIVTASRDRTAWVWNAATAGLVSKLEGHGEGGLSAQFSPDSQRIVTANDDKTARIWNAATGRQTALLKGHTDCVSSARFSSDGYWILTASDDTTAALWNAGTGTLFSQIAGHHDSVNSAQFSFDGQRIVTASADTTARVWGLVNLKRYATARTD
jgi:WD40 repeat protein/tRNA A-37 threonylcarbamoyl transferase component Bud32